MIKQNLADIINHQIIQLWVFQRRISGMRLKKIVRFCFRNKTVEQKSKKDCCRGLRFSWVHCQKIYNTHFPLLHYSPSIDIQLNQIEVKYPHSMMEQKLSMFLAIYKENSLFNSKVELIYLFIKCSFFIMVWSKLIKHIQVSKCLLFNSLFFLRSRISLGVAHQNMDPRVCGSPLGSSSFIFYWLLTMIITGDR